MPISMLDHDYSNLPPVMLLDMDGTITQPMLDFPKIKAEMGIGESPILEALAQMPDARRVEVELVLRRHEEQAAAESALNEGCRDLLAWMKQQRMRTALITRNSRASVDVVIERPVLVPPWRVNPCLVRALTVTSTPCQ